MQDQSSGDFPVSAGTGGWTDALRERFLAHLAEHGDVRAAADCCGLSRQSAYKLRARDPAFGRQWAVALASAYGYRAEPLPLGGSWRDRLHLPGPAGDNARRFAALRELIANGG